MSKKVSPIPRGYRTATTCLTVVDVDAASAFYQAAFGAEMLTRHVTNADLPAVHATVKIGNSIIALNQESYEKGIFAPVTLGASSGQVHLYLEDVELSWNRAVEAGAAIFQPLEETYWGDRSGILADGNGHLWSLASKVENVSASEIAERGLFVAEDLPVEMPEDIPLEIVEPVLAEQTVAA